MSTLSLVHTVRPPASGSSAEGERPPLLMGHAITAESLAVVTSWLAEALRTHSAGEVR